MLRHLLLGPDNRGSWRKKKTIHPKSTLSQHTIELGMSMRTRILGSDRNENTITNTWKLHNISHQSNSSNYAQMCKKLATFFNSVICLRLEQDDYLCQQGGAQLLKPKEGSNSFFFKIDLFLTWHTILKTQHSNYEPLQSQQDAMQRRMYTQTNNWRGSSLKN